MISLDQARIRTMESFPQGMHDWGIVVDYGRQHKPRWQVLCTNPSSWGDWDIFAYLWYSGKNPDYDVAREEGEPGLMLHGLPTVNAVIDKLRADAQTSPGSLKRQNFRLLVELSRGLVGSARCALFWLGEGEVFDTGRLTNRLDKLRQLELDLAFSWIGTNPIGP